MQRVNAGDYIRAKKQVAIYNEVKKNAPTAINPLKTNGKQYNENYKICVPSTCTPTDCSGGILTYAKNYELKLNYQQGKYYKNYACVCNPKNTTISCVCSTTNDLSVPVISNNCFLCSKCAL